MTTTITKRELIPECFSDDHVNHISNVYATRCIQRSLDTATPDPDSLREYEITLLAALEHACRFGMEVEDFLGDCEAGAYESLQVVRAKLAKDTRFINDVVGCVQSLMRELV